MDKQRLEAFSDGVIAIILTIMVLELKVPDGDTFQNLLSVTPVFISYVLSFIYVAIYWNNHHHMFKAVDKINGKILWANSHLLFWLSLIPFSTGWMGEHAMSEAPVVIYGVNLLFCALAYTILSRQLLAIHGTRSTLRAAIGKDRKGYISLALYLTGLALTFWWPVGAYIIYACVAGIWLLPDRRIETVIEHENIS